MTGLVFVDTNVLIYAVDRGDPAKQEAAQAWLSALWKARQGRVSMQVIQEFYAKVCQKDPSARGHARARAGELLAWIPVVLDAPVIEQAWQLQDHYQFSFWDSLIVAAARSIGCRYLLSEDFQAGQDLQGLLIVNPFKADPASLV